LEWQLASMGGISLIKLIGTSPEINRQLGGEIL
jgi:hypothetical protein